MLLAPLFKNATEKPDRIAIFDDSGSYTNAQLLRMAYGIGGMISASTKSPTVGILLPASAAFVGAFYGTLLAGRAAVPINFLLGPREIAHIIKDSGIDLILTGGPLMKMVEGAGVKVVDLLQLKQPDPNQADAASSPTPPPAAAANDLATLLYTSGTSGLPKGVRLSHGNLHEDVHACIKQGGLNGEHRFLGIIPLFHSTGMLATMIAPITLGAQTVYIGRFSPAATIKAIREHSISVMAGVPSMYGALCRLKDAGPDDFKQMYAAISGGEPLPGKIRDAFLQRFGQPIYEGYGLTETIGPIAFNSPGDHRPGSVGRPIPNAALRIESEDGRSLTKNETGEVLISGPMIMSGYHNLPEETSSAITPDGYFRSGDLGHVDDDGYLFITGRKKDVIIVAGEKVYPREVEELLSEHKSVAEAAVLGRPDESRGEAVAAYIVTKEGETLTENEVKSFCREKGLINWKIPKTVRFVDALPRSPTGKVLKRELATLE